MTTQTRLKTLPLFDLDLVDAAREDAIAMLFDGARKQVAFINADCVNQAASNEPYRDALSRMTVLLPDGSGLSLAARLKGKRLTANLNGTDLFPMICREARRTGRSIYFLGGKPGVATAAAEAAAAALPGLRIAGAEHGYFDRSAEGSVVERINASGADVLLVALGAPRQEQFIDRHADALSPTVSMGVGGLFDFVAGRVPRAPGMLRACGMEWAWRLACEPRRLAKRYLIGNPLFIGRAIAAALPSRKDRYETSKRILDVTLAGAALVALSPILFATALAIRAESKGGAFFTQTRIGKNGKPFRMMKFRSMHEDAEARLAAIRASSERDDVCFKMTNDPRVTRMGRILRMTSLDELPQLLNVVKGDMSLVGPRPALPVEVEQYSSTEAARLDGTPGITCLWQISGRADLKFKKQVDLDIAYLRSRSLLLDIAIICLTPLAMISRRGAY